MIDAYRIGIHIGMKNGVSSVLNVIQRDLLGLKKQVDFTKGSFDRMKLAAAGAFGVIAGTGALVVMGKLVKAGDKLIEQQVKLKALGVSPTNVALATGAAVSMAQTVAGTDPAHNLETIRELRGVLRNTQEAIEAAPAVLRAQLVLGQFGVNSGASDTLQMLKAMDIKGGFVKNGQLDVGALEASVKAAEAALTLTNGLLTPNMFYRFTRMAGPAATAMNTEQYLKDFTEVMMGLGSTGGRGLQMAAKTFLGGQVTKANVQQLESLGLVSDKDILKDHGHYAIKTGTLKGYQELLDKGFAQWFKDVVVPAMTKKGYHGDAAVLQALSSLPVTEQRLFSFLYTNAAQVEKFGTQYDQAAKTDQFDVLQNGSLNLNIKDFTAAWDGLMQAIGAPLVQPAIGLLKELSAGIRYLEDEAFKHPEAVKVLGETAGALGALAVVLGSFAIGSAAASALGLLTGANGILALAVGLTALGHALGGFPSWLVQMVMNAGIGYKLLGVPGAVGGALWGLDPTGGVTPNDAMKWLHKHGNLNDYAPGHSRGANPEDGIKKQSYLPPMDNRPRIQTIVYTQIDGRTIAKTVSEEQARQLSLPPPGVTRFDDRMAPSWPSNLVNA